jgi:hypothetical protein
VSVGVCDGVPVGAALGVRPAVTVCDSEGDWEDDADLDDVRVRVCVGDADGGGTVGQAALAPLRRSEGRFMRVQAVQSAHEPAVPAGNVMTAETPPADTVLCQPAAPSRQTSPSAFAVPVDVMLSGPTATTREPAQGKPSKVTEEMMQASRGLRSARERKIVPA